MFTDHFRRTILG